MQKPVREFEATVDLGVLSKPAAVDTALVPAVTEHELQRASAAETAAVDALARLEQGAALVKRRAELLADLRTYAIRMTDPADWVMFKDKHDNEAAMITAGGASKVGQVYGILVRNVRPVDGAGMFRPEKVDHPNGSYSLRCTFDAYNRLTGTPLESLEAERRSDEEFTGRAVNESGAFDFNGNSTLEADLRASIMTLCQTKAVRLLCAMTRVPKAELAKAWEGTGKSADKCRKGSGYGTSSERTARSVSQVAAGTKEQLRDEILRRVSGDNAAARSLLVEITASDDGRYKGFDSIDRITQDFIVERAWRNLRKHPTFGDAAQGGAPAEPGSNG